MSRNAQMMAIGRREGMRSGSAIAYGTTGHSGRLAFLILSAPWMAINTVSTNLYRHESWLIIIERRIQLMEQGADDLSTQVDDVTTAVVPTAPSRYA